MYPPSQNCLISLFKKIRLIKNSSSIKKFTGKNQQAQVLETEGF